MSLSDLRERLQAWREWAAASLGACLILLLLTLIEVPALPFLNNARVSAWSSGPTSWLLVYFVLQVLTIPGGIVLLTAKEWRRLPLKERLNPAYGFLTAAWFTFAAFVARGYHLPNLMILLCLLLGALLVLSYVRFQRARTHAREDLFP